MPSADTLLATKLHIHFFKVLRILTKSICISLHSSRDILQNGLSNPVKSHSKLIIRWYNIFCIFRITVRIPLISVLSFNQYYSRPNIGVNIAWLKYIMPNHIHLTRITIWLSRLQCFVIHILRTTKWSCIPFRWVHINGLVQERRNFIVRALELRLSCTNPSICCVNMAWLFDTDKDMEPLLMPLPLRFITPQLKNIVNHTQKWKSVTCIY